MLLVLDILTRDTVTYFIYTLHLTSFFPHIYSSCYGGPCFPQWMDFQRMLRLGVTRYHCLLEGIRLFDFYTKYETKKFDFEDHYSFGNFFSFFFIIKK